MPVVFTAGFMLLFSIVIALFKDIPDAKASAGEFYHATTALTFMLA